MGTNWNLHLFLNVMGDLPEVGSLLLEAVHSPGAELGEMERGDCSVRAGRSRQSQGCQAHKVSLQVHTNVHERRQRLQHPQEPQSMKADVHCAFQVPHTFLKGAIIVKEF